MRISLLCEIAEDLSASYVVLMRPLHGVTLPKSWLLKFFKRGRPRGSWNTQLHGELVQPILSLIGKLYTSTDAGPCYFLAAMIMSTYHILANATHADKSLSRLPIAARHLYIYRL